jgi:hypothetical protein
MISGGPILPPAYAGSRNGMTVGLNIGSNG